VELRLPRSLTDSEMAQIGEHTGGIGRKLKNRLPSLMCRLPV